MGHFAWFSLSGCMHVHVFVWGFVGLYECFMYLCWRESVLAGLAGCWFSGCVAFHCFVWGGIGLSWPGVVFDGHTECNN